MSDSGTKLHYKVEPADPDGHYFSVSLVIDEPTESGQRLSMPAWIPGSYLIREYARHIVEISASSGAGEVPLRKLDKDTWLADPCVGPLTIQYRVYAFDLSVRGAWLDRNRGYFNGCCLFLQVDGQFDRAHALEIAPPPQNDAWRLATTMPTVNVGDNGFGHYRASDYDELVDHPVELGRFSLLRFEAAGVPHEMAITGIHDCDLERLATDLTPICEAHIQRFGELPTDRYLFLTLALGDGFGGLEHRASSSLITRRDHLPRIGQTGLPDGYRDFLALCSHEYLHLWHVKRIRPAEFTPYDYSRESYTELLWVFEGITSYLDEYTLLRAGTINIANYLTLLGQTITRVQRGAGRFGQSLAESSFDAWTKFYRQDENAPNAIVSYYGKGAIIALLLDLKLRRLSDGAVSIDLLMRELWDRFGKPGIGVPENGVELLAAELVGQDLSAFFDQAIRGTDDFPLAEILAEYGVDVTFRATMAMDDRGGNSASNPRAVDIGMKLQTNGESLLVQQIRNGGPAELAGIAAQDRIVAIDGLKANLPELESRLRLSEPETMLRIHAFRRDELYECDLLLQPAPLDTCVLSRAADVSQDVAQRRNAWLGEPQ